MDFAFIQTISLYLVIMLLAVMIAIDARLYRNASKAAEDYIKSLENLAAHLTNKNEALQRALDAAHGREGEKDD